MKKIIQKFWSILVTLTVLFMCYIQLEDLSFIQELKKQINISQENVIETSSSIEKDLETLKNNVNHFTKVTIVRVKDGDTVVVDNNGTEETVRMIGIDTPESVHPEAKKNSKDGVVASEYTKGVLIKGTSVYLEYDEEKTDKYGRTLAYIWLKKEVNTSNYEDFCKYNYGAILLQHTYCNAEYFKPNGKYREWYEKLDTEF